jgi:hypothetical protein
MENVVHLFEILKIIFYFKILELRNVVFRPIQV